MIEFFEYTFWRFIGVNFMICHIGFWIAVFAKGIENIARPRKYVEHSVRPFQER